MVSYPSRVLPARQVMDMHEVLQRHFAKTTLSVLSYVSGFMQDVYNKAMTAGGREEVETAWGNLFYPARTSEQLCPLIGKDLFEARTYQVTPEMVDAVSATYQETAGHIGHFIEEELPSEAGFVWLDKPWAHADRHLKEIANRVVSWGQQSIAYPAQPGEVAGTVVLPGVRICSWYYVQDKDDYFDPWINENWPEVKGQSELILAHVQHVPYGSRFGGHPEYGFDMMPDDFLHWMHVLWMFLTSEIVVSKRTPVPRYRKGGFKATRYHDVNVITLRKAVLVPDQDSDRPVLHQEIDWRGRWWVQGHHRHLGRYDGSRHHATPSGLDREHCGVCGGRITWVKPYLKGPEDLPMLPTPRQLYRLER